jgi:hypothetical protein
MSEISTSLKVVLLASVAFFAIWFLGLRPKDDAGAGGAPPAAQPAQPAQQQPPKPQTGYGRAVQAARNAAAATDDATARSGLLGEREQAQREAQRQAQSQSPAKPATSRRPSSSPASTDSSRSRRPRRAAAQAGPRRVSAALARGDFVVLLFRDLRAPDDRAVASDLAGIGRRPHVTFVSAPVTDVGDYGDVTSSVKVLQSPTVLVISPKHEVSAFTGLIDRATVDQAIAAAKR